MVLAGEADTLKSYESDINTFDQTLKKIKKSKTSEAIMLHNMALLQKTKNEIAEQKENNKNAKQQSKLLKSKDKKIQELQEQIEKMQKVSTATCPASVDSSPPVISQAASTVTSTNSTNSFVDFSSSQTLTNPLSDSTPDQSSKLKRKRDGRK